MNTMKNILFKGVVQLLCIASILGCSRVGNAYMNSENSDNSGSDKFSLTKFPDNKKQLVKSNKGEDLKEYKRLIGEISFLINIKGPRADEKFLELCSQLENLLRKGSIDVNHAFFDNNKKKAPHTGPMKPGIMLRRPIDICSMKFVSTFDRILYSTEMDPAYERLVAVFDLLKRYGLGHTGITWFAIGEGGGHGFLWKKSKRKLKEIGLEKVRESIMDAFYKKTIICHYKDKFNVLLRGSKKLVGSGECTGNIINVILGYIPMTIEGLESLTECEFRLMTHLFQSEYFKEHINKTCLKSISGLSQRKEIDLIQRFLLNSVEKNVLDEDTMKRTVANCALNNSWESLKFFVDVLLNTPDRFRLMNLSTLFTMIYDSCFDDRICSNNESNSEGIIEQHETFEKVKDILWNGFYKMKKEDKEKFIRMLFKHIATTRQFSSGVTLSDAFKRISLTDLIGATQWPAYNWNYHCYFLTQKQRYVLLDLISKELELVKKLANNTKWLNAVIFELLFVKKNRDCLLLFYKTFSPHVKGLLDMLLKNIALEDSFSHKIASALRLMLPSVDLRKAMQTRFANRLGNLGLGEDLKKSGAYVFFHNDEMMVGVEKDYVVFYNKKLGKTDTYKLEGLSPVENYKPKVDWGQLLRDIKRKLRGSDKKEPQPVNNYYYNQYLR